jgi:hypothetical protein
MYQKFLECNPVEHLSRLDEDVRLFNYPPDLTQLFRECGGVSIRRGLYRVHTRESSYKWSQLFKEYFYDLQGVICPFGFDWLGRHYCLSSIKAGLIYMFDPSTLQRFNLELTLDHFHNVDLVDKRDDVVSENAYSSFRNELSIQMISFENCLATKVPLFLGGVDEPSNYQVSNMEVYWDFQFQVYEQIKNLPLGTKINSVKFIQ